jgi:hypothetical protein
MPGQIKIDDGAGNYTILTNAGSLGSDKTITIPNTTGTMALTSDISAGGLTEADVWEITSNISLGAEADITAWVRPNGTLQNYLGTGMSHSSGVFTFPSTGFWLVVFEAQLDSTQAASAFILATNDNSTYTKIGSIGLQFDVVESSDVKSVIVDVTDTANDKIKFSASATGGTSTINGFTGYTMTNVKFIKLGDT